jgi:hypothetical protein
MNTSATERELRLQAARSAMASVRLAGLEPSAEIEVLLAAWVEGTESLNAIHDRLMEQWRTNK